MFSSFYEPLPDINKTLSRIGCDDLEIRHDIYTLDRLIYGFLTHVPYENLSVSVQHVIPSLASADLYEKFVLKRRGGYCFEMNGFMWLLLEGLGFDAYSVSAYVLEYRHSMGDLGHRANVINIDGMKYLADVGFGGKNTAAFAVPMDGTVKNGFFVSYDEEKQEYTLCRVVSEEEERENGHGEFVLRCHKDGAEVTFIKIIMFRDFRAYPQEFYLPNIAVSHLDRHPMIDNIIVNLKNDKGETYTIYNDDFKWKTEQGSFSRKIESDEDRNSILRDYFGMNI